MSMTTAANPSTHEVPIPRHRPPAIHETSVRIDGLVAQSRPMAQWWVDLTTQLDELANRLAHEGNENWNSLHEQIRRDAPHLSPQLRIIDHSQERLERELFAVRTMAGDAAGHPERISAVSARVASLLDDIRRHEEHINQTLYDAYERDIGGESA